MIFKRAREHYRIVQIDNSRRSVESIYKNVQRRLKGGGCIGEGKWHEPKSICARIALWDGLLLVFYRDWKLQVSRVYVKGLEPNFALEEVYAIIHY